MAKVTIVGTHFVKPAGETARESSYHLTAWDQRQYGTKYADMVQLYKPPIPSGMVDTLRESLGRALAHFYPMAGRLRWAQGRLEVDCNAEGAHLLVAECDQDLAYFEAHLGTEKMRLLMPEVDLHIKSTPLPELPLMFVQITRLCCGGAAIGTAMSHVLVDGLSAFHLMTEWTRLTRGEALKESPYLDRKVMSLIANERRSRQLTLSNHRESAPPPSLLGKQSTDERSKKTKTFTLQLTEAQIHALKAIAAGPRAIYDGRSRPYSPYETVAAHIWRCACKARGHKEDQPTAIYITMNMRSRIQNVSLPPRYFGNAVFKINGISTVGEVTSNPLGFTCKKIRDTISKVDEDYIWSTIELLEKSEKSSASKSTQYLGNPNLKVTSWLTLPVYDADFGWGNPVSISPIVSEDDGASCVWHNNDGKSIQVVLSLQEDHVDEFKKYFYQDISINYSTSPKIAPKM